MPSWRPCSSTTRKFMNRCGASCSSLKSARCTASCVRSRTTLSSTSSSSPCANGRQLDELGHRVGQRHQARARLLRQALQQRLHLVLAACPGTSHSARSSLTWFSTIERHRHRHAVPRIARLVQVARRHSRRRPAACVFGKAAVVMPAASWRISSSRVSFSSLGLRLSASRYQRSKRGAADARRPASAGRRTRRSARRRPARPAGATCAPAPRPARSACGCAPGTAARVSHSPATSASRMKISRAAAGSTRAKSRAGCCRPRGRTAWRAPAPPPRPPSSPSAARAAASSAGGRRPARSIAARSPRCRGRTGAWSRPVRRRRSSGPASCSGGRPGGART